MPLPTMLCFAFAAGLCTAIAARVELRVSPRAPLSSRAFSAFLVYALLLLAPVSLYFYLFYGDWFLLYTLDVARIPSALALVGFGLEIVLGCAGFVLGAQLVRAQQESIAMFLVALVVVSGAVATALATPRLGTVGSYAQFHGGFGLVALTRSHLLPGLVLMSTLLVVGLVALVVRIGWGARRAA